MMDEQLGLSEKMTITNISRKKALIIRVGGLGDCLILTPIAKYLHQLKGYDVDYFVGSPTGKIHLLLEQLPYFAKVHQVYRVRNIDCIQDEDQHYVAVELLKSKYDFVIDYKFFVEDNRSGSNPLTDPWRYSLNSNYINWTDLAFAWANVDYTKVPDEEKRPEVLCYTKEMKDGIEYDKYFSWLFENTPIGDKHNRDFKVIGIQLQASSLTRSWYRAAELPELIHKQYPNDVVVIYTGSEWIFISHYGQTKVQVPEDYDPLLFTASLIQQMDIFISADTGASHLAEALGTKSIDIYTTVPAWTRVKYYKYAHPIEADVWCHPCFNLDIFCPEEKKKAEAALTDREKKIMEAQRSGTAITEVAKNLSTVPKGIAVEFEAAVKRMQALSAQEPLCVKAITPEMILNKLGELL